MVVCHIVTHLSLLHMIVVDNIYGNVKAIAGKENVKATYTQDSSWIVLFFSWTLRWYIEVSNFATFICCFRLTWDTPKVVYNKTKFFWSDIIL